MKSLFLLALPFALIASATMAETTETERARSHCSGSDNYRATYDCDCVAKKFEAAWAERGTRGWETIYNKVFTDARECALPKQIGDVAQAHCSAQYATTYHFHDKGKLGAEKFCPCVGAESAKLVATIEPEFIYQLTKVHKLATDVCGKLKDYTPSAAEPAAPTAEPIAVVPQHVAVTLDDNQTYLIIVNKNFDLRRLDIQQYKLNNDYVPGKNSEYATSYDKPVVDLPDVLTRRAGGMQGALARHEAHTLPEVALTYHKALIVRGTQLKEITGFIAKQPLISTVDYYLFADDAIYSVPDMAERLK